jgi:hypothetical protein
LSVRKDKAKAPAAALRARAGAKPAASRGGARKKRT